MPAEFDISRLAALTAEQRWPQKLTYMQLSIAQFPQGSLGDKNFHDSLEGKWRPKFLFTQPAGDIFHRVRMDPNGPVSGWINRNPDLTVADLLQMTPDELRQQVKRGSQTIDNVVYNYFRNNLKFTPYYLLVHDICLRPRAYKTSIAAEAEDEQGREVTKALEKIDLGAALILKLRYGIPGWNPLSPAMLAEVAGVESKDMYTSLRRASKQIWPYVNGYTVNEGSSIAKHIRLTFKHELEIFPADWIVADVLGLEDVEGLGITRQLDIDYARRSNLRTFVGERLLSIPDKDQKPERFARFNWVIEKITRGMTSLR